MGLRGQVAHFRATGLSDSLDPTDANPGAMALLQNLIPDPSTKGLFQCRPAAVQDTAFAGFTTPDIVSVYLVVGSRVFGLVASGRTVGFDEPFCYDLATNSFVTITGVTGANVPLTPSTFGDWAPPTMDVVGTFVMVTHPGFTVAAGNYIGWFDISNPASISWHAGNTTTNPLAYPATAVKNLNGRAYYAVNPPTGQPALVYSDVLAPTTVTNASQALFLDDNVPITALASLELSTTAGGTNQALIAFKGAAQFYQITGDAALSTLLKNRNDVATGTLSPRSIVSTPQGLMFIAPDGLRLMNFGAQVSDPIGLSGDGVTVPFRNTSERTRIAGAATAGVARFSVADTTGNWSEYWYDIPLKVWTGPHTFPSRMIDVYKNTFICAPVNVNATLFQSDAQQSTSSLFTENGTALTWIWQSSVLGDLQAMSEQFMIESTIHMKTGGVNGVVATFQALDENGAVLGHSDLSTTEPLWGGTGVIWGDFIWGGGASNLAPRQMAWEQPVVFRRLAIQVAGPSVSDMKIGDLYLRYQGTGYLQQDLPT